MGFLRLCLAMAVMQQHYSGGHAGALGAGTAVACFFVISGFLSNLVLDKKYRGELGRYWAARALRIYPLYFAALGLSLAHALALWWLFGALSPVFRHLMEFKPGALASGVLGISQLGLFGLDLGGIFAVDAAGALKLAADHPGALPLHKLVLLPQAWSLAVELLFYLAAPWVIRWPAWLLAALAVFSLALGCGSPWAARSLAPFQAGYFCLGILAWRRRENLELPSVARLAWLAGPALVLALPLLGSGAASLLGPLATAALLPGLSKSSLPLDRWMGDISYGLFLVHPVTGDALAPFLQPGAFGWSRLWLWPFAFLAAILLYWALDRPLQRRRGILGEKLIRSFRG